MIRRVLVHRCPAVPTAPNRIAGSTRSMFAWGVTMIALFPPSSSMVRPRRSPTTRATRYPILQLPVAETSGMRRSWRSRSPTVDPLPTTSEKIAGSCPFSRATSAAMRVHAIAVSGVWLDGFHTTASPHTAAIAVFQLHTTTGKLNAVMTPTTPSGCHCSNMRWSGRSECMDRP